MQSHNPYQLLSCLRECVVEIAVTSHALLNTYLRLAYAYQLPPHNGGLWHGDKVVVVVVVNIRV